MAALYILIEYEEYFFERPVTPSVVYFENYGDSFRDMVARFPTWYKGVLANLEFAGHGGNAGFPNRIDSIPTENKGFTVGSISFPLGNILFPASKKAFQVGHLAFPVENAIFPTGNETIPVGNMVFLVRNKVFFPMRGTPGVAVFRS